MGWNPVFKSLLHLYTSTRQYEPHLCALFSTFFFYPLDLKRALHIIMGQKRTNESTKDSVKETVVALPVNIDDLVNHRKVEWARIEYKEGFNIFSLVRIGEWSDMGLSSLYGVWEKEKFTEPSIVESYEPDHTKVTVE